MQMTPSMEPEHDPADPEILSPVDAVEQWRRGQLDREAAESIGGRIRRNIALHGAASQIRTAYTAARQADVALAAALIHEQHTHHALRRGLAAVHCVAVEPDELDGRLAAHAAARLATRQALRTVLVREYECTGCTADRGEACFANCLPSPRNAPDDTTPNPAAMVYRLLLPEDAIEYGRVFAVEADFWAVATVRGPAAADITERVVGPEAAMATTAVSRPDSPQV
jgi:hypothetical protein